MALMTSGNIGNFTASVNGYLTDFPVNFCAAGSSMDPLPKILTRIDFRLRELGIAASNASKQAGLSADAIRNMKRGTTKGVNLTTLQKLAPVLGTTVSWLSEGHGEEIADQKRVPLVGYVGAGGAAHFVPSGQLGDVDRPEWATSTTVAVEIRGESLGAMFDRWIVYYDDVRRPVTSDLIGRLCVVGLSDGRVLIKKIRKSKGKLYDLLSNNDDPIRNVEIEWAGLVKELRPR